MKNKSLAAIYKRQIKTELTTLKKAARKVIADHKAARKLITRQQREIDLKTKRLIKSESLEMAAINRRIAILQGRL
jgi:hypothetical protein